MALNARLTNGSECQTQDMIVAPNANLDNGSECLIVNDGSERLRVDNDGSERLNVNDDFVSPRVLLIGF